MISLTPIQLALGTACLSVLMIVTNVLITRGEMDAHKDEIRRLMSENDTLRKYAARAWNLFAEYGAVDAYDLREVDAVRDGLKKLGAIR